MPQNLHGEADSKLATLHDEQDIHLCRQICVASEAQGGSANESSHAGLSCDFSRFFSVILYSALLFLASGWSGPTKGAGSTQSPLDDDKQSHTKTWGCNYPRPRHFEVTPPTPHFLVLDRPPGCQTWWSGLSKWGSEMDTPCWGIFNLARKCQDQFFPPEQAPSPAPFPRCTPSSTHLAKLS